ncbi:MAG: hypothetical protein K2W96_05005, partial [Gemmataceae bacterium]|nr:hypothetical protein [Gemmataceae bacterium]
AIGGAAGLTGGAIGGQAIGGGGALGTQLGATSQGFTGPNTKNVSLRFVNAVKGLSVETGWLDNIQLLPDVRTNRIIVSAPEKAMDLILTLINELDVQPSQRAEVNIFPLKKADAALMAQTLQQLFLGTSSAAGTQIGGGPIGGGGAIGGAAGQLRPLLMSFTGTTPEGAPLIDLRIGVDQRTNSVIVAGSRNDVDVAEAIVSRLEGSDVDQRKNEVYKLVNSTAADVATALNNFVTQSLTVYRNNNQLTPFFDVEREVVVVPEPLTNKLLISATPRYFADIMRLIAELDAELPQVMISVLIAEVDLNSTDEFGVEIGLQSPVFFNRGVVASGTGISGGTTVNATTGSGAPIGFPFNVPAAGIPNVANVAQGVVGFQGLNNFGTGRISPNNGIGGFVFSAASDSFNLLIRALRSQGRADILSAPTIMTLDNQAAQVAVGQRVPTVQGSNVTVGVVTQNVIYEQVGVILNVIPKIAPDGKVTMRVTPNVSSLGAQLSLGNGVTAPIFNQQIVDTTVTARDGETIAIGGLITRSDVKSENKVPWLGDLPVLGTAFRYRQSVKRKQELLVILTPKIVRNRMEAAKILAEHGGRMDWQLGDIVKTHGPAGMEPLFPNWSGQGVPGMGGPGGLDGNLPMPTIPMTPGIPAVPGRVPADPILPAPRVVPKPVLPKDGPKLPSPRPLPEGAPMSKAAPDSERPLAGFSTLPQGGKEAVVTPVAAALPATPLPESKEAPKWRLFPRLWR